jgi:hypothetical protein
VTCSPAMLRIEEKYEGLQGLAQLPRTRNSGSPTSENSNSTHSGE